MIIFCFRMSKRKPTSELNDRNWDEEEEPEEVSGQLAELKDTFTSLISFL